MQPERNIKVFLIASLLLALPVPAGAGASEPSLALPNGAVGMRFDFNTGVQTPKGKSSASGTIALARTAADKFSLTVTTSDGTSRTIPLVFSGGTLQPNPSQTPPANANPESQAAAKALLANMKLAASIGVAARKSGGKNFTLPVTLTPVGQGTVVSADLAMKTFTTGHGATGYVGEVEQSTTTQLPPSGGIDPAQLEKSVGVGVATHGLTPAGRAATMVAMHHRNEEQKQAAGGELPDNIALSVKAHFAGGRFRDISGQQTDSLKISGKTVAIVSTWSFMVAK